MFFMNLPLVYRGLAVFLVAVGLFTFGYYKGFSHEKEKFDQYKTDVAAAAEAQESKVKLIEKQASNINKDITHAYDRNLAAVRSYYQRLLDHKGSGELPSVSSGSPRVNAGTKDQLPAECAGTTLQLIYLQKWVKDQESLFNEN